MNKLYYEAPLFIVVTFREDVLTTSGGGVTKGVDHFDDYFGDDWRANNG